MVVPCAFFSCPLTKHFDHRKLVPKLLQWVSSFERFNAQRCNYLFWVPHRTESICTAHSDARECRTSCPAAPNAEAKCFRCNQDPLAGAWHHAAYETRSKTSKAMKTHKSFAWSNVGFLKGHTFHVRRKIPVLCALFGVTFASQRYIPIPIFWTAVRPSTVHHAESCVSQKSQQFWVIWNGQIWRKNTIFRPRFLMCLVEKPFVASTEVYSTGWYSIQISS